VQPPFRSAALLRSHPQCPATKRGAGQCRSAGSVIPASPKIVEAEYEWRSNPMPAWGRPALSRCEEDSCTVWTWLAKSRITARDGVTALLKLDPARCGAIWVAGPGSYGRNDGATRWIDARSVAGARPPVRGAIHRARGHAGIRKPASVHKLRAGIDATGRWSPFSSRRAASRASTSPPAKPIRAMHSPPS